MKLTESRLKQLIKEVLNENPNYEFIDLTAEQLKNVSDRNIQTFLAGEDSMGGKYYRSYFVVNGKQVKYYNPIHNRSYFLQFVDYSMEDSIQNLLKRKNKIVSRLAPAPPKAAAPKPTVQQDIDATRAAAAALYDGKSTREILDTLKQNTSRDVINRGIKRLKQRQGNKFKKRRGTMLNYLLSLPRSHPAREAFRKAYNK